MDENGEKISKSRGNGLTVEEWLRYGTPESLSLFMYRKPRAAKRLHFDVIPRQVDDYGALLASYDGDAEDRVDSPLWHIHAGAPPAAGQPVSFAMLLNLASACNAEERSVLWGFIARYVPGATPRSAPLLDRLADLALNYYRDIVKPAKRYPRRPTPGNARLWRRWRSASRPCPATPTARPSRERSTPSARAMSSRL